LVSDVAKMQSTICEYERIMEVFFWEVINDNQMKRESLMFSPEIKLASTVFKHIQELHKKAVAYDKLKLQIQDG